jgi:hypothetical protein
MDFDVIFFSKKSIYCVNSHYLLFFISQKMRGLDKRQGFWGN